MARPPFTDVGKVSTERQAFWFRRTFKLQGQTPQVALLKFHKARYGLRAILNGHDLGTHLPCFTPAYFDVKPFLKDDGQDNVLLVRLGANPECLPSDMPRGWDFEKYLFIPGLYDSVELILTGAPFIQNVQIVPDLEKGIARAFVEVAAGDAPAEAKLKATVREAARDFPPVVRPESSSEVSLISRQTKTIEIACPLSGVKLWSPEDPFLYEMTLATGGDATSVRFGMRSFRFDPATGRAMLNGKPYYLRGTNVCIYRFFEDAQRGDLPWRADWVRRLHQQFKRCTGTPSATASASRRSSGTTSPTRKAS